MNSFTEENYLKAIYKLNTNPNEGVSTNSIAELLQTKASSVTDMVKKLSDKQLVKHVKYKGVSLTNKGKKIALSIIRNHRLWEVFLVEKLDFKWDEVHEIAEDLEHIRSAQLVNKLDAYLGFPKYDPHGDPIPDQDGNIAPMITTTLDELSKHEKGVIVGVKEHSTSYLKYLEQLDLVLGTEIIVNDIIEFDSSISITINDRNNKSISHKASKNLIIKKL